jgi:hypothetical protein
VFRALELVIAPALMLGLLFASCERGATEPPTALLTGGGPGSADAAGLTWSAPIEVASGNAFAGPWRMNESQFHYVDDPSVALKEDGTAGVVWVDNRRQDVFFRAYGADGAALGAQPTNVSRSPRIFSWLPRLVMTGDDVWVLWEEIVFSGGSHGGEIFFARSADGGATFGAPVNLSNTPAGAGKGRLTESRWDNGSLDLVRGAGGEVLAAWTEYEGPLWFSRSLDGGETFSAPLRVAGDGDVPARGPSLAAGSDGTLYLAWTVGEDRTANIHLAISRDHGRLFEPPRTVWSTGGHSDAPQLATDAAGALHLVHMESPAGPGRAGQVRYARLEQPSGTFETPRIVSSPPAEDDASAAFPSLAVDGEGSVAVVWEHHPRGAESRGLGFALSRDGGRTFAPPGIVPGTSDPALGPNAGRQGNLMRRIALNRRGDLAVVSSHFLEGERSRVRLVRAALTAPL